MKKIFTSMLLMGAALLANAQNFTVTAFGGTKTLQDGDVIECGYVEGMFGTEWNPELEVTCNKNMTLVVTANVPSGNKVQFCYTEPCVIVMGEPVTKSNAFEAGTKVPLRIDIANGNVVEPFDATIKITDGQETVNITVTFVGEPQDEASISSVAANGTAISVRGRTLNFNTDSAAELTLYTISGQSAISRRISGRGSLNLSNLPAGVYIYRAGKKTGKLILR